MMKSYELKGETTYLDKLVPKDKAKEYEQEERRHRQYLAKSVSIDRSNIDHDTVNYIFEECDKMGSIEECLKVQIGELQQDYLEAKDTTKRTEIKNRIDVLFEVYYKNNPIKEVDNMVISTEYSESISELINDLLEEKRNENDTIEKGLINETIIYLYELQKESQSAFELIQEA